MKSQRRQAREHALQILYQMDLNPETGLEMAIARHVASFSGEKKLDAFSETLLYGVHNHIKDIDSHIQKTSEHWKLERMSHVDRNVLRLGTYEILHCNDIPATVTINEMIELAKSFGTENSAPFINGVLDKIKAGLNNPKKAI